MNYTDITLGLPVYLVIGDYARDESGRNRYVEHEVDAKVEEIRPNNTVVVSYTCPFTGHQAVTVTDPVMLQPVSEG